MTFTQTVPFPLLVVPPLEDGRDDASWDDALAEESDLEVNSVAPEENAISVGAVAVGAIAVSTSAGADRTLVDAGAASIAAADEGSTWKLTFTAPLAEPAFIFAASESGYQSTNPFSVLVEAENGIVTTPNASRLIISLSNTATFNANVDKSSATSFQITEPLLQIGFKDFFTTSVL
jgi:hypothetical protein